MKKIYTLLVLALISGTVAAQTKKDGVTFGIRAGVNIATVALSGNAATKEEKDAVGSVTSYNFGGYANIPVSDKFSIQPGLSLSGKGFTLSGSMTGIDPQTQMQFTQTINTKTDLMYIELPVNAVFNFDGFYFGAGPYLAYAIAGQNKIDYKISSNGMTISPDTQKDDVEFGNGVDEVEPLDFGINGLAGYRLDNGLNFGVNYGIGLGKYNNNLSDNLKISQRVFSILVGFSF